MNSASLVSLFGLAVLASLVCNSNSAPSLPITSDAKIESCSANEALETPCRCCKMDCWYTIAKSATHELGHIPGQEGEVEALATLRLIRTCMIAECSSVCASQAARPFRPIPKLDRTQ